MKYFTEDNTFGFTKEQLSNFNDRFPKFAAENGFDLNDQQDYKSACYKFHNEVMIHG